MAGQGGGVDFGAVKEAGGKVGGPERLRIQMSCSATRAIRNAILRMSFIARTPIVTRPLPVSLLIWRPRSNRSSQCLRCSIRRCDPKVESDFVVTDHECASSSQDVPDRTGAV